MEMAGSSWWMCPDFHVPAICGMLSPGDRGARERESTDGRKGVHCEKEIILVGVRWYVADPLSSRHVEALMQKRGVSVDHATLNR